VRISTESLLMEGARRIDEWSRIADKIPHLGVVPSLAPVDGDHPTLLDLLPNEWEVLSAIDGAKDLKAISGELRRSEFDVARIAYGLVTTGVIELRATERPAGAATSPIEDPRPHIERATQALATGRGEEALSHARQAVAADPTSAAAHLVAARALLRLGRISDAGEELRRAAKLDPLHPQIQRELGYAAARRGDFEAATASWLHYLSAAPGAPDAERVREAVSCASQLRTMITEHIGEHTGEHTRV
jgi:tetratricopeptide (TPR) repeat protein